MPSDLLLDNYQERLDSMMVAALGGDLESAARAGFFPKTLSPEERKTLSDKLGIKGPGAELLDIATNPFILGGLILTLGFKALKPNAIAGYGITKELKQRFFLTEMLSPVIENYWGTDVPAILQHTSQRFYKVMSPIAEKLSEVFSKYKPTKDSLIRTFAALDGLDQPGNPLFGRMASTITKDLASDIPMYSAGQLNTARKLYTKGMALRPLTDAERAMKVDFRSLLDKTYRDTLSSDSPELIMQTLHHMQGLPASATSSDEIKYLMQYAPHIEITNAAGREEAARRIILATGHDKMRQLLGEDIKPFLAHDATGTKALRQAVENAANRRNSMVPDTDALAALSQDASELGLIGQFGKNHSLKTYSVDPEHALFSYFDAVGRSHAWAARPSPGAKPLGYQMTEELAKLFTPTGDKIRDAASRAKGQDLLQTILPAALGARTPYQYAQGTLSAGLRAWAAGKLNSPIVAKVMPKYLRESLTEKLLAPGPLGATHELSSYLFASTLGGNLSLAVYNLPQAANTIALTGVGPWAKSVAVTLKDAARYVMLRARSIPHAEAAAQTFGDIFSESIEMDPLFRQSIASSLEEAYSGAGPLIAKGQASIRKFLMTFFRTSEAFNRTTAFRAGKYHFADTMMGEPWRFAEGTRTIQTTADLAKGSMEYGTYVTNATHYGTGILNTPRGLLGVDPLFKQFLGYPARQAAFVLGPLARNPNALGRAALSSGIIYEAGKRLLNIDLSRATVFGGIPSPQEGLPGAPLPTVPPIFQLAAAVTNPVAYAQKSLPLLVPGGVAAARLLPYGVGSETAGKALGRNWADYSQPVIDAQGNARYAVRKPDGSLVGHFTKTQLWLQAFGFKSTTMEQEQQLTAYIVSQRDRMRQYKKDYLDAISVGDQREAQQVNEEYIKAYPGFPMPITKLDMRALHMRRDVSRLERVLNTVPTDQREMFSAIISKAIGQDTEGLFALQESGLMSGNTITQRDSYRLQPRPRVPSGIKGSDMLRRGETTAKQLAGF